MKFIALVLFALTLAACDAQLPGFGPEPEIPVLAPPEPTPTDDRTQGNAQGDSLTTPIAVFAAGPEVVVRYTLAAEEAGAHDVIVYQSACDVVTIYSDRMIGTRRSPGASIVAQGGTGLRLSDATGRLADACAYSVYTARFPDGGGEVSWGVPAAVHGPGRALVHVLWQAPGEGEVIQSVTEVRVD